jgi:hypothetical protein
MSGGAVGQGGYAGIAGIGGMVSPDRSGASVATRGVIEQAFARVNDQVVETEKFLSEIAEAVRKLDTRLSPVLVLEPPAPAVSVNKRADLPGGRPVPVFHVEQALETLSLDLERLRDERLLPLGRVIDAIHARLQV